MAILSLAPGAPPAFLSKPFVTTDALKAGGIFVSSGDAFKHRAFDMSPVTQATSQGQAAAGAAWTYQAKVYEGSTVAPKATDCVALLNINFKRFKVEYRLGGGAWTIFPGLDYTAVDCAAAYVIAAVDPAAAVLADEWLVTATDTRGGNVEKAMGYFLPCAQKFQASTGTSDLKLTPQDTIVTVEMFDGSTDETLLLHNDADFDFKSTPLLFLGIPDTEEPSYAGLRGDFFLFVPQPGKYPLQWFLCRMVPNTYDPQPLSMNRDSNLMRVAFQVKEVGGA